MIDSVQSCLLAINSLSKQLLSQLEDNNSEESQQSIVTNEESQLTGELLANIAAERQSLIAELFKVYTQKQLSTELPLVNEMASLDQQLTEKAQLSKQAIAEKLLKLKGRKKVTKLYQKY
ncbi:hypothetical protein [Cognaticolwellia mytili]|uniref:hypothetical protein n=1 Tax=Cognaticolwellia mytili TaxID=1888913 RepID=UPI000A175C33|nr:hypothetical protein [Cognaticolwellia mytili]